MKILIIHQAFATLQEGGGTRHYEFAQHLIKAGHEVIVITSSVNYLTGQSTQQGSNLITEETIEGIRILRVYTFAIIHRSFLLRLLAFWNFTLLALWAGLKPGKVDIVFATSPNIFQAAAGLLLAKFKRVPFLLEIRDLWPDSAIQLGVLKNPLLIAASRSLEHFLYHRADHIVILVPGFLKYFKKIRIEEKKITLITNGVDISMFDDPLEASPIRQQYGGGDSFVVLYIGSMGLANDVETLIRAANHLRADARIIFLLIGDGKERPNLEQATKSLALSNVHFLGAISKTQVPHFIDASDVCVAIYQNNPLFHVAYPNKVFDYMAGSRPILLVLDGDMREIIENSGAGIFVPPGNDYQLAEKIQWFSQNPAQAKQMGQNGRAYVVEHFNRHNQAQAFLELVQGLVRA